MGFRVLGLGVLGFRVFGFIDLRFQNLGFKVLRVYGFQYCMRSMCGLLVPTLGLNLWPLNLSIKSLVALGEVLSLTV